MCIVSESVFENSKFLSCIYSANTCCLLCGKHFVIPVNVTVPDLGGFYSSEGVQIQTNKHTNCIIVIITNSVKKKYRVV